MDKNGFMKGWRVLKTFYQRLPDLEDDLSKGVTYRFECWFEMVGKFRPDVWEEGCKRYCQREKYAPTPTDIREYCFEVSRELKEQERKRLDSMVGESCPWCNGSGWVLVDDDRSGYPPRTFPCQCSSSKDPELGAKILAQANDDAGWEFDQHDHCFYRRTTWLKLQESDSLEKDEVKIEKAFENDSVASLFCRQP